MSKPYWEALKRAELAKPNPYLQLIGAIHMSKQYDGGPAFPVNHDDGMSLRDYFAAQVMVGLVPEMASQLAAETDPAKAHKAITNSAELCYLLANAMLEARKR